jgi:hypothetical protein
MRIIRNLIPILCLFATPSIAQVLQPAPGYILTDRTNETVSFTEREYVIWSEDFANGIPATWSTDATPAPVAWEYRGPLTDPSNESGTRGSCISNGTTAGLPMTSPTAENGFVIFDSNYWDDNVGPCGNFGSGQAPGPHYATLTTPTFDLSAYPQVGLRFNQFCKNYQAETRIEFKVGSGDWEILWVNDVPLNSGQSEPDRFDRINITTQLGGMSDVQLRFVFDGNYYYWMLDDIKVFELETNNLIIESATYGDFNPDDQGHETGFEYMEYSQYPSEMSPLVNFNVKSYNWGAETQTGSRLEGVLRNDITMDTIYTTYTNPISLGADDFHEFRATPYALSNELGQFSTHYRLIQNEEDDSPDDNHAVQNFEVTDVTYSRDRLETEGLFVANSQYAGIPYEMGNFFVITADNQACHSVSIAVGNGTDPTASVYGAIYKMKLEGGIVATTVAMTEQFGVTMGAYNTVGDNNVMTIPFSQPVSLDKDSVYLIVAGTLNGPDNVYFTVSGESPLSTSMVRFFPNSWFYSLNTPMVRANFGPVVNTEEIKREVATLNCYPNPTNQELTVECTGIKPDLTVFDSQGRLIYQQQLTTAAAKQQFQINTSAWSNGMYLVAVTADGITSRQRVVIQH